MKSISNPERFKTNLFGAMLELRSLPNDVDVFVCNLPFYRQKIEEDVRLLDDLDVEVRAENVFDNSGV